MPYPKHYKKFFTCFSPSDWEVVCTRSKKLLMKPTTYIKTIAVQGEIKKYNLADAIDLTTAINRVGRNINQIARVDNDSGGVYQKDIELMQAAVTQMKKEIEYYLAPLDYEKMFEDK